MRGAVERVSGVEVGVADGGGRCGELGHPSHSHSPLPHVHS